MKLQEYLMTVPMVQKYADRYFAPLIKYVDSGVPDKLFYQWVELESTTLDDLAMYYIGVLGMTPNTFVGALIHLEKHSYYKLPAEYGILTIDYWETWKIQNVVRLMDEYKTFMYGK